MASLPIEVSRLIPIACALAKASTTLARAPLCSATPTGPAISGGGSASAYGADQRDAPRGEERAQPLRGDELARGRGSFRHDRFGSLGCVSLGRPRARSP